MPLPVRKQLFVAEYLVDLCPGPAAIRAGYSARTANQSGHRLLQEPAVKDAVADAMAARSRRTGITADRVLRQYARIAFADIRDTVTWGPGGIAIVASRDIDDDAAAAIAEVSESVTGRQRTMKVKLNDRMAALRMLASHLGIGDGQGDEPEDIGADEDPPVEDTPGEGA